MYKISEENERALTLTLSKLNFHKIFYCDMSRDIQEQKKKVDEICKKINTLESDFRDLFKKIA